MRFQYIILMYSQLTLRASETGLLLVVKLRRNVVMMSVGVKLMHEVLRVAP